MSRQPLRPALFSPRVDEAVGRIAVVLVVLLVGCLFLVNLYREVGKW